MAGATGGSVALWNALPAGKAPQSQVVPDSGSRLQSSKRGSQAPCTGRPRKASPRKDCRLALPSHLHEGGGRLIPVKGEALLRGLRSGSSSRGLTLGFDPRGAAVFKMSARKSEGGTWGEQGEEGRGAGRGRERRERDHVIVVHFFKHLSNGLLKH